LHFKHKQSQVLSPDSYVKKRTQPTCIEYIDATVGMPLDQRSYWDLWKFFGRPWRYQHGIWIREKK